MIPMLLPFLAYLFKDSDISEVGQGLLGFLLEQTDSFMDLITNIYTPFFRLLFDFLQWAYSVTIGAFIDLIVSIIDSSKDDFVLNGQLIVNRLFDKLSFTSASFTDNFIFWVIGLLFFSFTAKYVFSLAFGLLNKIIDMLLKF